MSTEPEESIWDNYRIPTKDETDSAKKRDYVLRNEDFELKPQEHYKQGGLFEQMQQANVHDYKKMTAEDFSTLLSNLSKQP